MLKRIFLTLIVAFSAHCFGQSAEDSTHIELLLTKVASFEQTDIDSALTYAEEAYKMAHNGKANF